MEWSCSSNKASVFNCDIRILHEVGGSMYVLLLFFVCSIMQKT